MSYPSLIQLWGLPRRRKEGLFAETRSTGGVQPVPDLGIEPSSRAARRRLRLSGLMALPRR